MSAPVTRARRTRHPELAERQADLQRANKTAAWRQLSAAKRFHLSYGVVPGAIAGSDCWSWIGTTSDEGYPHFMAEGWKGAAHRFAIEEVASLGPLGARRVTRRCGNTSCVNPDHLAFDAGPQHWEDPLTAPQLDGRAIPRGAATRFAARIDKDRVANCWWWTGTIGPQGYGQITVRRGWLASAHRFSFALAHGSVPGGRHVCHGPECEDHTGAGRLCVNPDHLMAGTHADNMADKGGGHFRRALSQVQLTGKVRAAAVAFLPDAVAIGKEQGDLNEGASLAELLALDAALEAEKADFMTAQDLQALI